MNANRRAVALLEILVATILLATLVTVSLQFLVRAQRQRVAVERREVALQAAENMLERLSAIPWSDLTPQAAANVKLDAATTAAIGGGAATASVTLLPEPHPAKQILVEVDIPQHGGGEQSPVRLSTWVYPRAGS